MKIRAQNNRSIWTCIFAGRQAGNLPSVLGGGEPGGVRRGGGGVALGPAPRAQCVRVKGGSRGTVNVGDTISLSEGDPRCVKTYTNTHYMLLYYSFFFFTRTKALEQQQQMKHQFNCFSLDSDKPL